MPNAQSGQLLDQRQSFKLKEFCGRNGMSLPSYYKMRAAGLGPREIRIPGTSIVRISVDAEVEWRRARENPTEAEAAVIARNAERMRTRARSAASKSVASDRHVSRQRGRAA